MRPKNPTFGRLLLIAVLVHLPTRAVGQGEVWTVDDAVRVATSNPDLERLLATRIAVANAQLSEATVLPTPLLSLSHEQVLGPDAVAAMEISVGVAQELNLVSWRERLRDALPHRESALKAEVEAWQLDVAAEVHTAFFRVRYHEERVHILDGWIGHLEGGVAHFLARGVEGDVAPFEVRRVERELEIARAERAREASMLVEAWAALRAWTPWSDRPRLDGPLAPPSPEESPTETSLPRLELLEHRQRALSAEAAAWGDPFWRGWTLGAGYRLARAGDATGHGFLASLQIPLPLWDTQQPTIDRLEAERLSVSGELALERVLAGQAEQAARERVTQTLEVLASLSPPEEDGLLTHMAETAYQAGEATLTELLDAYESEASLLLARTDLAWEARRAAIELGRRRGTLDAPPLHQP